MIKKQKLEIIVILIILFVSSIFIFIKPFQLTIVSGHSMEKTLYDGEILLMNKGIPNRNDIVTFNAKEAWKESSLNKDFIKRVVGIPYDEIKVLNNKLYINNKEIINFEDKLKNNIGDIVFKLSEDEYFVIGDNVGNSHDSLFRLLNGDKEYTVNKKLLNYKLSNVKNKNELD